MDGYFIFTRPVTGQFFISAILDGTDFDALDFATAERSPDDVVRVIADHGELWLFGTETTEVWYNAGLADFPFERIATAAIERGCVAPATVVKMDNSLFWLGDDLIVYRANGYVPQRVSTHGMEAEIEGFTRPEDAFGWSYTQGGHKFYILTFPGQRTFVFDAATGAWHERKTYGRKDWEPQHYSRCYNRHLVGGGKINSLNLAAYTDEGAEIVAEIFTVPYGDNTGPIIMRQFQLDIEAGVGLPTGQGSVPQAMLRFSDDGKTWSHEQWRDIGAVGQYANRVVWRRLGLFRQRSLHIVISDPVKRTVMGGFVDYG